MAIAIATITSALVVRALVVFIIIGVCAYLVDKYVPMPEPMKIVFRVVVVLLLVLWLLTTFSLI